MQTAKSSAARRSVTFTLRRERFTSKNTNRFAVPLRRYSPVEALQLSRPGGNGLARLADELDRALVEADHWALGAGRFGRGIEHILHAGDVVGVDLGNAPHVLCAMA